MVNTRLLVRRRNGLGPGDLPPRGANGGEWHIGVDHPQSGLDHLAAIVHFGDDAISAVAAICGNRSFSPIDRGVPTAQIGKDVAVATAILADDDDSRLV